jgi:tartronate-semialdehyde synthase
MNEAFYLMREGRPGPVLIEFPLNVQNAELDFDIDAYEPKAIPVVEPEMDKIKEAVKMIGESKAPVIVMGGGCFISDCCDKVVELAETLQIPVITTYQAKGGIPEDHPLNAGHAGIQVGQPIGNKVFLDSDLVIGIGNRFSDRHTGDLKTYCEGRKFIHINIEPSQIGMVFQAVVNLFNPATAAETVQNSASVVGIAIISKSAAEQGFVALLEFTAMISVSLGIMNLIPIPPLDGGRFVVEVYQKIAQRNISLRALNGLSIAGVALFLGLFVIMVGQDIQRIFTGFWS